METLLNFKIADSKVRAALKEPDQLTDGAWDVAAVVDDSWDELGRATFAGLNRIGEGYYAAHAEVSLGGFRRFLAHIRGTEPMAEVTIDYTLITEE